ncbi:MAG: ABC transporter substrate-binding protein [Rhizobiaceae bacterium]
MVEQKLKMNRRMVLGAGASGAAGLFLGAAPFKARAAGSGKKLSLIVFGPTQQALDWLKSTALAEFTKQTGYEIEVRPSDWGSGFQKLLTAVASGTLADVTMLGQVMTPALMARGAFLPINDRLAKWADTEKFYPAMLKDGTYGGKSYAIPIYADVRTSIYRSDILQKVGVGPDELPKNWDEFKALAQKLSTKNGGPLQTPFFSNQDKSVGLMQTFSMMLYQAGGGYFDESGKAHLSSDAGVRALDYLVSFYKEGLANPNVVYQGTGPRPLVLGTSAMTYNSVTVQQNAAEYKPDVEKFILAGPPLAADKGGKPSTIAWINKFAVSANTKDPDGAWALISYLTSKDISAKFAEIWGGLPARTDLSDAAYLKKVSPGFVEATKYAGALPTSPNLLQIQQQVNIAMQSATRQSGTSKQILEDLDKKIDEINAK